MPTNFPSSADSFTNPSPSDSMATVSHADQHTDVNDAVEAIETALLDGAPLHIDDANERVGIGTTSPEEELHIAKDQNGDLTQVLIENLDQRVRIGAYYEAGVIQYGKIQSEQDGGGNIALALNPEGGNVGVNTTTPTGRVHIYSNTAGNGQGENYLVMDRANTSTESAVNWATNGTSKWFLGTDNAGNDDLLLYGWTSGQTSVQVSDSSGHVTRLRQYCYYGDNTGGADATYSGTPVIPPTTYFNEGSLFNTSNGRFTLPAGVSGYVLCSFDSLIRRSTVTAHAYVEFQVNGVRNSVRTHTVYDIGGNYQTLNNTAIVYVPTAGYVTCVLWNVGSAVYTGQYGSGLTFRFLG